MIKLRDLGPLLEIAWGLGIFRTAPDARQSVGVADSDPFIYHLLVTVL